MYGFYIIAQSEHAEGAASGRFSIHQLKRHQSPFYQDLAYQGHFMLDGKTLPCTFYRKFSHQIKADCDYWIEGELKKRGPFDYALKPKKLTPIEESWSLAELRFRAKERFRTFLQKQLSSRQASTLLFALIGGEVEERSLRHQFSKIGVQHLLAISGFHFSFLIAFLSSLLGLFVSRELRWGAILVGMASYFLFIGSAPAVERAWMSATLFFVMKWIKRDVESLNLLGAALLIEIAMHPLSPANVGFQLSYASCFGLLVFFKPLQHLLSFIFPMRRYREIASFPIIEQLLCLLSAFFRNSIALSIAVNVAIFPLLLIHFGSFPILSLLYNLFYPQLISLLLFSFLVTAGVYLLIPAVGSVFFVGVNAFAQMLSNLAIFYPVSLDWPIHMGPIPPWTIPFYLLALLALNFFLQSRSLIRYTQRTSFTTN